MFGADCNTLGQIFFRNILVTLSDVSWRERDRWHARKVWTGKTFISFTFTYNRGEQSRQTKFRAEPPNIFKSSAWNVLQVTVLASRISRRFL